METVNWLAVVVAGISSFVLGGVWYSPALFGKAWMQETGLSEEELKKGNKPKIFGWSIILSLVMSVNLAMYLSGTPDLDLAMGLLYGTLSGVWIICGIAIVGLFELKSAKYIFINGGYCVVQMALMGGIIGAWR